LWIGEKRTVKTLVSFFRWLGKERSEALRFVCSDMWKPYLKVIAKKAGQAVHVLDRFHIMAHLGKAIDEVRTKEVRELKARGRGTNVDQHLAHYLNRASPTDFSEEPSLSMTRTQSKA
jgi:transposase